MTPNLSAARALRDLGAQSVLDFAGDDWRNRAIALCTRFFAAQAAMRDARDYAGWDGCLFEEAKQYALECGLEEPHHDNAWGAVCLTMSRRGIIVKTGRYINSAGVRSHGRVNPLWRLA